ncbi:MAG: FAD-dependent oxidoreductase [Acidiferrobacterales bacterium]
MIGPRVVIVGAGPAGLMAACEAHNRGAHVTLVDEAPWPGGQIYRQAAPELGASRVGLASERKRKQSILEAFARVVNDIDYRANATAYAVYPGPEVHIAQDDRAEVVKSDALILATGLSERAVPFPGWTLPGVLYAGGTQALMKAHQVRAGDNVVIAGTGPLPIALGAQLVEAGAKIHCIALLHPLRRMAVRPLALWAGRSVVREGFEYLRILKRAGVELLEGWIPLRADGSQRVEHVTLARHDGNGRPVSTSERRIGCDLLAINFGFTANSELVRMAGAKLEYHPERGGWIPLADRFCRTSVDGVLVAGDGAGLRGAWVAAAEGRIAGAAAVESARQGNLDTLSREVAPAFAERKRHTKFQLAVGETLRLPPPVWSWADDDTVICRCEGVTRKRLQQAIADGHVTLDAIKRNTRAGMGWCGGRTCLQTIAALTAEGHPSPATLPMTPRPLARPVQIGTIAECREQTRIDSSTSVFEQKDYAHS